jgi:SAM-dependent methyltransferase
MRYPTPVHDVTKQNRSAYDTHADAWASAIPTNEKYALLEKPAMEHRLPTDLTGKRVLCIGVGSGEELATLLARNPQTIVAIDISQKLLDIAHARYPEVQCMCIDMTHLDALPTSSFDVVYSSLAFHYAHDWDILLAGIARVMKQGGVLLFSTHHPVYWAKRPTGHVYTNARGVKLTQHTATLPGGVDITYYNHPDTDSIREALVHAGFHVNHAFAPSVIPIPEHSLTPPLRKKYKNLVKTNEETPLLFLVRGRK